MKPINIYALTRVEDVHKLARLERQMSGRKRLLKIRQWEIDGLRKLCGHLAQCSAESYGFEFYYSFVMPKLGKEFDLLRINENMIVNIELKSRHVSDELIRKQLQQNKYYLATLGRNLYFYTYISEEERLVRLSGSGRLVEADMEELAVLLERQQNCETGNIEDLFKEDRYLISPLSDPDRFLRRDYFLTFQQKDIKRQILNRIGAHREHGEQELPVQGFTGLPGTGKTLLLYDIALNLSENSSVCVLHFGSHESGLEQLDRRLKRVDYYYCVGDGKVEIPGEYAAILVDEGHRVRPESLREILAYGKAWDAPVIFTYDKEDVVTRAERELCGGELLEAIPGFHKYQLTNRIRMNSELSSFIHCFLQPFSGNRRQDYPSVSVSYAGNVEEAVHLLQIYINNGYVYIQDNHTDRRVSVPDGIATSVATCKEFERVVMLVDESFYYDTEGNLRANTETADRAPVRDLYHGLNRAKKQIALVVLGNRGIFDAILTLLQGKI